MYHMYLVLHFQRIQSLSREINFLDTRRLSSFFRHCETDFSPKFLFLPSIFDILQQNGCSKNPKASPFYIFRHYATYRKLQKNSEINRYFFSQCLVFLTAFVVSSCRKRGFRFRVFLSLRYGANFPACLP